MKYITILILLILSGCTTKCWQVFTASETGRFAVMHNQCTNDFKLVDVYKETIGDKGER